MTLLEPADLPLAGIPAPTVAAVILVGAVSFFCYVMYRRMDLLRKLMPDFRFDDIGARVRMLVIYGFGQLRQPRYLGAGILHILLFAGFILLSLRSLTLIGRGFSTGFHLPGLTGTPGFVYESLKDYTVLIVLAVCVICMIRRAVFKPARYDHPGGAGHEHEAYVILGLVSALMITDMLYDGSAYLVHPEASAVYLPAAALASLFMSGADPALLERLHVGGYWLHILVFFGLLNYLPISKHFHVITALPNVFFAKLHKGAIKPVRYGVEDWMSMEECGVGRFEAFTWKNVLDFYSCADCGRCTDNCPANAAGRKLSPKMISIKARDYAYEHYPIFGPAVNPGNTKFVGDVITEEEIWSCTTCGACEQECPIFIEYIDKIVDMRRYLLDQGSLPQSLQKPMQQVKKKGNAYGGNKVKRAAWAKDLEEVEVRELKKGDSADYLFFVDSCGSFDPRIQEITKAFARILSKASCDFGILGQDETESGNEIRRLGEEGLFEQVAQKNIDAFQERQFREIVTFDPHAFNVIKNDYPVKFPVLHASQLMAQLLKSGKLQLSGDYLQSRVVTYHDPCYLGRHNDMYEDPRFVLGRVPGMRLREMTRSFSRSFCCSGGGLLLWYESEEEKERMGEKRVRMAQEVQAEVIVTACPFCLINLEDAVKTTGNEGKIEVIDLVELVDRSLT
ncbi:(Fe-S)-binding protein [Desulfomonile tiedjei]|uniref:Fe-S oxidoreductase n=1 Tax=Desulfomonile tiedjei (strain ATCC 49306 / DSM 6799 / DCB-1) TaxID=706587 RepID=I4C5C3_DESTA|nr:(Fe-S)-binding protein [Desulfomonile tiedjei]AFM24764.1 Fe-S oxidoreductase [Desulfomonile tiedjei DSM 6799]